MPITNARTSPPYGLRSTSIALDAAASIGAIAIPAAIRQTNKVRNFCIHRQRTIHWKSFSSPLYPPIKRVDIFFSQSRRIG